MKRQLKTVDFMIGLLILIPIIFFIFYKFNYKNITIWAWEAPQDLRFLKGSNVRVVVYAGLITLKDGKVGFTGRHQPVFLDKHTKATPVIRIENYEKDYGSYADKESVVAQYIANVCLDKNTGSCQIDYDVKKSEVPFYKNILLETRKRLPANTSLSITSIASWCDKGSWLSSVSEIDEVVPMLFSMGADSNAILSGFTGSSFLKNGKCLSSVGVSADEQIPPKKYISGKTVYIFHSGSWDEQLFKSTKEKLNH